MASAAPLNNADSVLSLFESGQLEAFNAFLSSVPEDKKKPVLVELVNRAQQKYSDIDRRNVCRRIGQHPAFSMYWSELPHNFEQGLFFCNLPFLKTRILMSFFRHPTVLRPSVDYSLVIYDVNGALVFEKSFTIKADQTQSIEVDDCIKNVPMGMVCVRTTEPVLNSLRFYAQWYNENSITTTHEKGYLANYGRFITYPTIVSDPKHETFFAVSNFKDNLPIELSCFLQNSKGESHPARIQLSVKPRGSVFLPLSQYFQNMTSFLGGMPGALYVNNSSMGGMYYYFIHNKELQTWQAQHL